MPLFESLTDAAVFEQPFADVCGQEFHVVFLSLGFLETRKEGAGRRSAVVIQDSLRFGRVTHGKPETKESLDIDDGARPAR